MFLVPGYFYVNDIIRVLNYFAAISNKFNNDTFRLRVRPKMLFS